MVSLNRCIVGDLLNCSDGVGDLMNCCDGVGDPVNHSVGDPVNTGFLSVT